MIKILESKDKIIENQAQRIKNEGSCYALRACPNFGKLSRLLCDPNTPDHQKITIYVDLGYLGIVKIFLGAIVKLSTKRSKYNLLIKTQKEQNAKISKIRALIEHVIARLKQ